MVDEVVLMKSRLRQFAWFAGLWLAGVATLTAIAGMLRWLMGI